MQQARRHRGVHLRPSLAPGGQANWFRRWNEVMEMLLEPSKQLFPLPCFFFFLRHASLFSLFVLAEVWGNLRTGCRPSVWQCLSIFTWLSQWLGLGMVLVLKQFVAKKTEWQSVLKEVERWREKEQHRRVCWVYCKQQGASRREDSSLPLD